MTEGQEYIQRMMTEGFVGLERSVNGRRETLRIIRPCTRTVRCMDRLGHIRNIRYGEILSEIHENFMDF